MVASRINSFMKKRHQRKTNNTARNFIIVVVVLQFVMFSYLHMRHAPEQHEAIKKNNDNRHNGDDDGEHGSGHGTHRSPDGSTHQPTRRTSAPADTIASHPELFTQPNKPIKKRTDNCLVLYEHNECPLISEWRDWWISEGFKRRLIVDVLAAGRNLSTVEGFWSPSSQAGAQNGSSTVVDLLHLHITSTSFPCPVATVISSCIDANEVALKSAESLGKHIPKQESAATSGARDIIAPVLVAAPPLMNSTFSRTKRALHRKGFEALRKEFHNSIYPAMNVSDLDQLGTSIVVDAGFFIKHEYRSNGSVFVPHAVVGEEAYNLFDGDSGVRQVFGSEDVTDDVDAIGPHLFSVRVSKWKTAVETHHHHPSASSTEVRLRPHLSVQDGQKKQHEILEVKQAGTVLSHDDIVVACMAREELLEALNYFGDIHSLEEVNAFRKATESVDKTISLYEADIQALHCEKALVGYEDDLIINTQSFLAKTRKELAHLLGIRSKAATAINDVMKHYHWKSANKKGNEEDNSEQDDELTNAYGHRHAHAFLAVARKLPERQRKIVDLVLSAFDHLEHRYVLAATRSRSVRMELNVLTQLCINASTKLSVVLGNLVPIRTDLRSLKVFGFGEYTTKQTTRDQDDSSVQWRYIPHSKDVDRKKYHEIKTTREKANKLARRLEVVWSMDCCRCCGFSTEVEHMAIPLERHMPVMLSTGSECFCPSTVRQHQSITRMHVVESEFKAIAKQRTARQRKPLIWISHTDPMLYDKLSFSTEDGLATPAYFIGRSMFEFSRIQSSWVKAMQRETVNEIWVPSTFVRDTFIQNGVKSSKVFVVPEAIDTDVWSPVDTVDTSVGEMYSKQNTILGLTEQKNVWDSKKGHEPSVTSKTTVFLSQFKFEPRKGWNFLFRAYMDAFKANDDVVLVVLTQHWFVGRREESPFNIHLVMDTLKGSARDLVNDMKGQNAPRVVIVAEELNERDVVNIYRASSCFVLPTRGEGWGLPVLQALSVGIPTIVTNYSGVTDFINEKNSYLLKMDEFETLNEELRRSYRAPRETAWATPNFNHLIDSFRRARRDGPARRKQKGRQGRALVLKKFSEEAVAKIMLERMNVIGNWLFT